ncbi:MAG TPA: hypothetical protein VEH76_05060 [Methylocystis sp.]|nr:hypothetical protein [Methylocystis sp.]
MVRLSLRLLARLAQERRWVERLLAGAAANHQLCARIDVNVETGGSSARFPQQRSMKRKNYLGGNGANGILMLMIRRRDGINDQ